MANMNSPNGILAICYLQARDGRCCTKKYGYGCGKTFSQLIQEANESDEQTGYERKLRLIMVDRIDNKNIHKIDIYDEELMKKYQIQCRSCNKKKDPHRIETTQAVGRKPTREKLDALIFEPTYHKNLQTFLQDNQEGCYVEIMMNSKNFSDGANQVTCKRYFEDNEITNVNEKGIYQKFPHKCNSENCNAVHVCLVGMKPEDLIQLERIKLESTWFDQYGSNRQHWKTHSSYSGKHFMELEEYIETHAQLIAHDFQ